MSLSAHPFRGPLFMILATGSYVVNDTMMKLATANLPPYEVLMLRGTAALIWGLPLLFMLGYGSKARLLFDRRVLLRNICETAAVLCFVVALANMPIADATALGQITPLLVLLGASLMFGERIGGLRMALIGCGFIGALMVAQPTGQGISFYAVLAIANALLSAVRDLAGRRVGIEVPGMIVAISAVIVVLVGAGVGHVLLEEWVMPSGRHALLLAGAGLFLIFGHFFIFMAYRVGPTGVVAPFYYCFTVWAVISGLVVFQHLPNSLAIGGIVLVIASGLAIVLLDERKRRLAPVGGLVMKRIANFLAVAVTCLAAQAADFTQTCRISLRDEAARETEVWKGTLSRSEPHSQGIGAFSLDLALSSDFQIEATLVDDKNIEVATLSTEGSIPKRTASRKTSNGI